MHVQLVLKLRVKYDLIDLVSFKFLAHDFEVIFSYKVSVPQSHIPHRYCSSRVTHKQSALIVESETVWMRLIKNITH